MPWSPAAGVRLAVWMCVARLKAKDIGLRGGEDFGFLEVVFRGPSGQGPGKHSNKDEYFWKRGSTIYRRFPAAGPPSTTDFRCLWAVLFDDPGPGENSFMCHSFMCCLLDAVNRSSPFPVMLAEVGYPIEHCINCVVLFVLWLCNRAFGSEIVDVWVPRPKLFQWVLR